MCCKRTGYQCASGAFCFRPEANGKAATARLRLYAVRIGEIPHRMTRLRRHAPHSLMVTD
jgi:hypothetical protein